MVLSLLYIYTSFTICTVVISVILKTSIFMMCSAGKWSIRNGSCAHQWGFCNKPTYKCRSWLRPPTHALNGAIQPKRPECGATFSRHESFCYFQLREKKLHLSLSTKAKAMPRPLLFSVITHDSHCSPHWVIFLITTVICYFCHLLWCCVPALSFPYAWSQSVVFCLLKTQVPTRETGKLQIKSENDILFSITWHFLL